MPGDPTGPPTAYVQLVSMVLTFLTTIGVAWIGYLTSTAKTRAEIAAERAEAAQKQNTVAVKQVANNLVAANAVTAKRVEANAGRLDHLARVADSTHTLVNGAMTASLLATLNALKAVRRLTTDPEDVKWADAQVAEAQRAYDEHLATQKKSQGE